MSDKYIIQFWKRIVEANNKLDESLRLPLPSSLTNNEILFISDTIQFWRLLDDIWSEDEIRSFFQSLSFSDSDIHISASKHEILIPRAYEIIRCLAKIQPDK